MYLEKQNKTELNYPSYSFSFGVIKITLAKPIDLAQNFQSWCGVSQETLGSLQLPKHTAFGYHNYPIFSDSYCSAISGICQHLVKLCSLYIHRLFAECSYCKESMEIQMADSPWTFKNDFHKNLTFKRTLSTNQRVIL